MDYRLLAIPAGILIIGVIVMIVLNKRGSSAQGVAQNTMKNFVLQEIPSLANTDFKVIHLLEDAINAQHIWVLAYNHEGMYFIPAISNPITRSIKKYEELDHGFDIKKTLAANLWTGNKSEKTDFIRFSDITKAIVNEDKKNIQLFINESTKKFKYQMVDMFGANQEPEVLQLILYLNPKNM